MTEASGASLELAILLPLGVIANQLMKIEADLRVLNMKALVYAKERESGGPSAQIGVRLEKISELLDLIRGLVSDVEADIQPRAPSPRSASARNHAAPKASPERDD